MSLIHPKGFQEGELVPHLTKQAATAELARRVPGVTVVLAVHTLRRLARTDTEQWSYGKK